MAAVDAASAGASAPSMVPANGPGTARRRAAALGRAAEVAAAAYLTARGYRIVTANFRVPGGEVDLVAWDAGGVLCFVEVRARADTLRGHPLETIDRHKQARIGRAAVAFAATLPSPWPMMRFDALGIVMGRATTAAEAATVAEFILVQDAFERRA